MRVYPYGRDQKQRQDGRMAGWQDGRVAGWQKKGIERPAAWQIFKQVLDSNDQQACIEECRGREGRRVTPLPVHASIYLRVLSAGTAMSRGGNCVAYDERIPSLILSSSCVFALPRENVWGAEAYTYSTILLQ